MPSTVVLAGGGTGGHVYPALAMGDALKARGHTVYYYGEAARLEGRVAPERGYVFRAIDAVPYPRAGVAAKARFFAQLAGAAWATRRLLVADRADLVLGVGGYVMAPTVFAAWSLGRPSLIHESNVSPGLANQACARVARKVLLTYAETATHLPAGVESEVVGCPVHPRILQGDREAALQRYALRGDTPILLVVGGSLGAQRINELGLAAARDGSFQVLHVTGPRYHQEFLRAYGTVPPHVRVVDYEHHMADAYAAADLVLCRAGSSTLAELCAVGRPAVLVPSPNVTDNHQEANARGLERAGAALVYLEEGMDPGRVVADLRSLLHDAARLRAMGGAARGLAKVDVAERVADLVEQALST